MRYSGVVKLLIVLLAVFSVYSTALATPINPYNNRPVSVTVGSEPSLQSVLNGITIGTHPDAATDQIVPGMFGVTSFPLLTGPSLVVENTGNASTNSIGIWSGQDTNNITRYEIFPGNAQEPDFSTIAWQTPTTGLIIYVDVDVEKAVLIPFSGINAFSFGFYLNGPGGIIYSVDQLNPANEPGMLAYHITGDTFALAFEDEFGGDDDYQDAVIKLESVQPIHPMPEPSTIALLGLGITCLGFFNWRRKKKSS